MSCANCHHATPTPAPAPLFQIRHGYRARWNDLAFSVETDCNGWALQIQDFAHNETLYTAHRVGSQAAQLAAAEYAIFRVLGPSSLMNADRLVKELVWQSY
jgi:hypothetical protein